ncbi:DUF6585 family protein [Streptosporangium sp. NPDC049376]|uniref:DUF6585 family protein n=1 Tax=Streptosporangium sp. NPDC049376 TaxID=3366192 RepID=UPI00379E7396
MPDYPPKIIEIVDETGLGEIVDCFRQSVLAEAGIVVVLTLLGAPGILIGDDVGRAMGAVALGLALLCVPPLWLKARRRLYLCSNGLLLTTGDAVLKRLIAWEDVAYVRKWTTRVYQRGGSQDVERCILMLKNGGKLNLARPPYARDEELTAAIEHYMSEISYPRRAMEIAETGSSTFGPITVTAEGVRDGDRLVRWSEITGLERARVRLRIWTGFGRPAISRQVRTIPDVAVLVALVAEGVERHRLHRQEPSADT